MHSQPSSTPSSTQVSVSSVPTPTFWWPGQTTTSISHFRWSMGNSAAWPTMRVSDVRASTLMPVAIICRTHFAQASSFSGGSPWKEFLG